MCSCPCSPRSKGRGPLIGRVTVLEDVGLETCEHFRSIRAALESLQQLTWWVRLTPGAAGTTLVPHRSLCVPTGTPSDRGHHTQGWRPFQVPVVSVQSPVPKQSTHQGWFQKQHGLVTSSQVPCSPASRETAAGLTKGKCSEGRCTGAGVQEAGAPGQVLRGQVFRGQVFRRQVLRGQVPRGQVLRGGVLRGQVLKGQIRGVLGSLPEGLGLRYTLGTGAPPTPPPCLTLPMPRVPVWCPSGCELSSAPFSAQPAGRGSG